MKTNHIEYRIGETPYVWVVKSEDNVNVYFKYENALKAYKDEFIRLRRNSNYELSLNVNETKPVYYAVFYRKNNWNDNKEKVVIYVEDKKIMDAKIYD